MYRGFESGWCYRLNSHAVNQYEVAIGKGLSPKAPILAARILVVFGLDPPAGRLLGLSPIPGIVDFVPRSTLVLHAWVCLTGSI